MLETIFLTTAPRKKKSPAQGFDPEKHEKKTTHKTNKQSQPSPAWAKGISFHVVSSCLHAMTGPGGQDTEIGCLGRAMLAAWRRAGFRVPSGALTACPLLRPAGCISHLSEFLIQEGSCSTFMRPSQGGAKVRMGEVSPGARPRGCTWRPPAGPKCPSNVFCFSLCSFHNTSVLWLGQLDPG